MKQMEQIRSKPAQKHKRADPFPAHGHACLNCGHEVVNHFCSMCGQSTSTHRLSVKHFVLHDLVHSLWHLDRGIFFTLKEVLIKPGYAALDYIRGKRAGKFPILTLLLLLIGALLWLNGFNTSPAAGTETKLAGDAEVFKQIVPFIRHNMKWILLALLPIGSVSTLAVFRRTGLNYTEHLVVNSYVFGGLLVVLLVAKLIMLAIPGTTYFLHSYKGTVGLLFYVIGYWQAYHGVYKIPGMIWRYGALVLLNILLLIMAMIISVIVVAVMHPKSVSAVLSH